MATSGCPVPTAEPVPAAPSCYTVATMVVRVAPGQVRFVLPQLTVDARGVVQGRDLVLRFPTLDRLVTFLRFVSAEMALAELGADLKIRFARAPVGSRELLFFVEQVAPQAVDALARAARNAHGQAFTGSGRHFVAVRDTQAPLGYDVEGLVAGPGDVHLYTSDVISSFHFDGEMALLAVLLRLSLVRIQQGPESLRAARLPPVIYVTARQGLGGALVQHLHHAGAKAEVAVLDPPARTGAAVVEPRLWLFRIEQPPQRLRGLFAHTPGLMTFVPVTENVAVAAGYRHPVHLDACRGLFEPGRLVLFLPPPEAPRIVAPLPPLAPIEDLVRVPTAREAVLHAPAVATPVETRSELRLVQVPPRGDGPVAALVPWHQVPWLERIAMGLPQSVLAQDRIVALDAGLLVVAQEGLQWFPFGRLLTAAARGVLVPVGFGLRPAVSSPLLEERLGTADGSFVVFPAPGQPPFRVAGGDLVPLEKHVLAQLGALAIERQVPMAPLAAAVAGPPPEVRFGPGMAMPLWGQD